MQPTNYFLPLIVLAQFCCTSLWFAGNAIIGDLALSFELPSTALGHLTSVIQLGFIAGTLTFAVLSIADRYSPSRVFMWCALAGAGLNGLTLWSGNTFLSLLVFRLLTGFCLAGIYSVGMKIAADHFDRQLGKSLGFLVGALVLGTAFPHLLKGIGEELPWRSVVYTTSGLAVAGGLLIGWLVPDGPYRSPGKGVELGAFLRVFNRPAFRRAAFGYFGHMWELYAFWAFVPVVLLAYVEEHDLAEIAISRWSFVIIAVGGVACVIGGYLAGKLGTKKMATLCLMASGCCCLLFPLCYFEVPFLFFISFLIVWGMVVVADSPLFSTLVAQHAPPELRGTALTIVNCIGFAITIVSIQLLSWLVSGEGAIEWIALLAVGPIWGVWQLRKQSGQV